MTAVRRLAAAAALLVGVGLGGAPAWASPEPATPPAPTALKVMSATFAVSDLDRAVDFYVKGLGLTAVRRIENPTSRFRCCFRAAG